MKAIECVALRKEFVGRNWLGFRKNVFVAVADLAFAIECGEAVAFLGPNGAGKSTTIKLLCGILRPTAGECRLLELEPGTKSAARQLGLVFGTRSTLAMHMTAEQCLVLNGVMYGLSEAQARNKVAHYSERFGVSHLLSRRVRTLSLGERMRTEIVAAILHEPKVLLLDEPTIGLDVVARDELRTLLATWRRDAGATLLLTSHDMHDVERLCDRALVIDHGRLIYDGTLPGLKGDLEELSLEEAMMRLFKQRSAAKPTPEQKTPELKANGAAEGKSTHLDTESLVARRRESWGIT